MAILFEHDPDTANTRRQDLAARIKAGDVARTLAFELVVPARTGRSWEVKKGQLCRMSLTEGPQAGDFNAWNLDNPREHFWAGRTRMIEGTHVTTGSRLWSTRPYHRPMLTIVDDTFPSEPSDSGARCHDLLGSGCDPFVWKLMNEEPFDRTCYNNLARAIAPHHLTEFDVHEVLNLFQISGLDPVTGQFTTEPCPGEKGDYVEFIAEMDLLCAMSACPAGDISIPHYGPERGDPTPTCKPLTVTVFDLSSDAQDQLADPTALSVPNIYGSMDPMTDITV